MKQRERENCFFFLLIRFFTVSEAVCKEYEQLKHQYDVETSAMHKAMQQASQVN